MARERTLKRRDFLKSGTLGAAALMFGVPNEALAIGSAQKLRIVAVRHSGSWRPHEGATRMLAEEVRLRTSIDVALEPTSLAASHPELALQGLAVLTGTGELRLERADREALARWIDLGGFLLVDNAGRSGPDPGFDRAVRRELEAMFPGSPMQRVSSEHVIYRSFYRLDYPAGRGVHKPYTEAVTHRGRLAVVYTQNDLLGALARDRGGRYLLETRPGGSNQREMAVRFAINTVMYAFCMHYKDDQVHLDYLLHKRKWKIRPPR